ncbi:MAG: hypothetical protein IPK21_09490 [Haliscomenobacter sp.]|nr:hypothetical protein [Haliscomenobacter sp.]
MNIFVRLVALDDLSGPKVRYYSVQLQRGEEDWGIPEVQDFFERHEKEVHLGESLEEILAWLDAIAWTTGANLEFFRDERSVWALPPERGPRNRLGRKLELEFQESNSLRLYLIRLNESIVILLNGGEKTTRQAQECPNVKPYFIEAQKIAKAIDQALIDREIAFDEMQTDLTFDQNLEIPLP